MDQNSRSFDEIQESKKNKMNLKGKLGMEEKGVNVWCKEDTEASEKKREYGATTETTQIKKEMKESAWKKIAGIGLLLTVFKCCIKGITDTIVISVGDINPIVLIFFRSIIIFSLIIPMGLIKEQPPFPTTATFQDHLLLVFRSIIGLL